MVTVFAHKVKDVDFDKVMEVLSREPEVRYLVYQLESSEDKKNHFQIYVEFNKPMPFSTVKKCFHESAHLEARKGTRAQCRLYCMKDDSRVRGPYEHGMWVESGQRVDLQRMYEMVTKGYPDAKIMDENPTGFMRYHKCLDKARQVHLERLYATSWTKRKVVYLYGPTACGKTKLIADMHGYDKIFRVTNYAHPFDGYAGQPVMVFDEFCGKINLHEMLNFIDGHPILLPCRYADKVGCYDKVYIISNEPLSEWYDWYAEKHPDTYSAWVRRIHEVHEMDADGSVSITRATPCPCPRPAGDPPEGGLPPNVDSLDAVWW